MVWHSRPWLGGDFSADHPRTFGPIARSRPPPLSRPTFGRCPERGNTYRLPFGKWEWAELPDRLSPFPPCVGQEPEQASRRQHQRRGLGRGDHGRVKRRRHKESFGLGDATERVGSPADDPFLAGVVLAEAIGNIADRDNGLGVLKQPVAAGRIGVRRIDQAVKVGYRAARGVV